MTKNYYISGEHNVTCDVCSKKIKAHDAKQRWDGLIVCPNDYEQRHPQDFVRVRQDKITVPFSRPIPPLEFIPNNLSLPVNDLVYTRENMDFSAGWYRDISDFIPVSDTVSSSVSVQCTDTVTISDSISYLIIFVKSVNDSITLTDNLSLNGVSGFAINGTSLNGEYL